MGGRCTQVMCGTLHRCLRCVVPAGSLLSDRKGLWNWELSSSSTAVRVVDRRWAPRPRVVSRCSHALTTMARSPHHGNMSAGELLVQRLHVDLRRQASGLWCSGCLCVVVRRSTAVPRAPCLSWTPDAHLFQLWIPGRPLARGAPPPGPTHRVLDDEVQPRVGQRNDVLAGVSRPLPASSTGKP